MDIDTIKARCERIKSALFNEEGETQWKAVEGAKQGALTILQVVYGAESQQVKRFLEDTVPQPNEGFENGFYVDRVGRLVDNALTTAVEDLESGLARSIRVLAKGEVLGDFVALARNALAEGNREADNVAAVLAAAALEDTLKQVGESHRVDVLNRDMRGVIQKLKDTEILVGAQASLAAGLVDFRNKAMHGQFETIERETTTSALGFVEALLLREFS